MDIGWGTVALSLLGAILGTFGGAWLIEKKREEKAQKIRDIAIKSLKIFEKYSGKNYSAAKNDFDISLNITEKRTILVSLHKIGVPISMPVSGIFSIKDINFDEAEIDKNEIYSMISQINSGHCDHFFFNDVDSYFNEGIRVKSIRRIAKRYVNEIIQKSKYDREKNYGNRLTYPCSFEKIFTPGEQNIIAVFSVILTYDYYYDDTGSANLNAISTLITEIDSGLWDSYLQWDYASFKNLYAQIGFNEEMKNIMPMIQPFFSALSPLK